MAGSGSGPISGGVKADTARVQLAPEIVPLLSAQLYQSPLKAIEELVVNSYDADASNCFVSIKELTIAVVDNGVGMDLDALKNLWHVGRSGKRTDQNYIKLVKRTQIGKFGIGKLAANSRHTRSREPSHITPAMDRISYIPRSILRSLERGQVPLMSQSIV